MGGGRPHIYQTTRLILFPKTASTVPDLKFQTEDVTDQVGGQIFDYLSSLGKPVIAG